MFSVSNLLWQHLPKFRFVQLPFRWLLCMNAALAMLLTMAARRWTSRLLASAVLLAAVIVAGYRIQPPWWETASDIREMSDALADGTGYEGTDEYVPAGADAYELDKSLPLLSDDAGAPVPSQMLAWGPIEKHFYGPRCDAAKSDRAPFQLPGVGSRGERQAHRNTNHRCHSPDRYSHCCRRQRCSTSISAGRSIV